MHGYKWPINCTRTRTMSVELTIHHLNHACMNYTHAQIITTCISDARMAGYIHEYILAYCLAYCLAYRLGFKAWDLPRL